MSDYDDSFAPGGNNVDLSDFDDDFSSAEAPSFDEVPDGKYQVRIDSVRLDRSQRGDPMIKWDLLVIAGQHQGRHIFKNSVITLPLKQVPETLHHLPGVILQRRNSQLEIHSGNLNSSMRSLLDLGVSLEQMQVRSPTLEDLFLELTGHELRA